MFIESITIKNFKCFENETIKFKIPNDNNENSLNIFVGENNSGKSTVFEAIAFLRNGTKISLEDLKNKNKKEEEMFVEIEFSGNIKTVIKNFSKKKLDDFIAEENGNQIIKARRSDKIYKFQQSGKDTEMNPKKIGLWNFKTNQFENPSGIDADFKKLFEIDFVWADTNPEDIIKFGTTTICGKLLSEIVKSFEKTNEYKEFSIAHQKAFNNSESGLKKNLDEVEKRTREIFKDQFGSAKIEFHFDQIDIGSFFKNTRIKVNDGLETYLEEKGSGMQRSVALALLQVYAENIVKHSENENIGKPFFLFIDEPEICLHPQAQKKLLFALKAISKTKQIFISTHSPYFIIPDLIGNIFRFENKKNSEVKIFPKKEKRKDLESVKKDFLNLDVREIFFAKKVLCLEGETDLNSFQKYFAKNIVDFSDWTIVKMNSKEEAKKFWKILKCFCLEFKIILDLDALFGKQKNRKGEESETNTFKNFLPKIQDKIVKFGKLSAKNICKEKRCELLFNENLKEKEIEFKNEILEDLKKENVFVLQYGMLENYLDKNGEIIDNKKEEKETELKNIFKT